MRKRPMLLSAAVAALGLAALGTVVAQQPGGAYPPAPSTSSGTLPATTVRPFSEWTPTAAPAGYTPKQPTGAPPTGGYLAPPPGYVQTGAPPAAPVKPRLTNPTVVDGSVRPASGQDMPPPNMDIPSFRPSAVPPVTSAPGTIPPPASTIPAPTLPPPVSRPYVPPIVETESKFPPTPPLPTPVTGNPGAYPAAPLVPVPPSPMNPAAPSPFPVATPTIPPIATPPVTAPLSTPSGTPITPTTPTTTLAPGMLPARTTPSVTVEAVCPETVVFGQEFAYKLIVRNTSTAAVSNVRVDDELPSGSRYVGSDPVGELNGDRLVWLVGTLESGAEKHITVRVKPSEEGEARSRATVTFTSSVDARTRVTRPRLAVVVAGTEVCRAGEETAFQIKVTNSGTGPAPRAIVRAQLSDGLMHSQGVVIEAPLENLPAGDSKIVMLKVAAAKAGLQWCQITVTADGSQDATAKASTNVVEPMLVVKQTGPAKCLVRAEPTYTIELSNPGTAATDPVLLQSVLPEGFEWINMASDGGSCSGRTVSWRLPALPAGGNRTVTLKLRASVATDPQGSLLRTVASAGPANITPVGGPAPARPAGRVLECKVDTAVVAEGVAAVRFEVIGLENPVSVGKEVTYEIRVMNSGTGPCSNVQLAAALAEGTEFMGATTGSNQAGAVKSLGQQLTFDILPTLGVKGEMVYRVRVKGNAAGDLRFRVQLSCDQLKTPIVKEESTTFVKE